MIRKLSLTFAVILFSPLLLVSQNSNYRSLLPEKIMDEIIGEVSGETAMQHIIEMGAYNHNRPASSIPVISSRLIMLSADFQAITSRGLKSIVTREEPYWDGISGELWEVKPGLSKLADYDDLTAMLAQEAKVVMLLLNLYG
ncbi:MAG: hypothetical protein R2744_05865 [Bacteroidales bacterium]